jgi:hypothetical protein
VTWCTLARRCGPLQQKTGGSDSESDSDSEGDDSDASEIAAIRAQTAERKRGGGLLKTAADLAPEAASAPVKAVDPTARASRWFSQPLFDDVLADTQLQHLKASRRKRKGVWACSCVPVWSLWLCGG